MIYHSNVSENVPRHSWDKWIALGFVAAIIGGESMGAFWGLVPGLMAQAALILALLCVSAVMPTMRDSQRVRKFLMALALVALVRVLSAMMPVRYVPVIYWYALVGVPVWLASILTLRALEFSWSEIGWAWKVDGTQLLIGLLGLPLSIVGYITLQPRPLANLDAMQMLLAALILIVFTGWLEEFVFRGVLLKTASDAFGKGGVLISSAIFASMYFGTLAVSYIFFMAFVGLLFGWIAQRTRSGWGVALAHGLMNVGMFLVLPFLTQ